MRQKGCDCLSLQKIEDMKLLVGAFVLCLFVSCGKYKKPFISFKSPEERLTQNTWRCVKMIDQSENEFEVFDELKFSINGSDSTLLRISDHPVIMANVNQSVKDTVLCNWTWAYALDGEFNKQQIIQSNPSRIFRVISLSNRVLVLEDESVGNVTYHYERF